MASRPDHRARRGQRDDLSLHSEPHPPSVAYQTNRGMMIEGTAEQALVDPLLTSSRGKVQLVFTSPPFPLNNKKRYGNRQGSAYEEWLRSLAPLLRDMLTPTGSIVIELGNAWEAGRPVMSTLALRSLYY